MVDVMVHFK